MTQKLVPYIANAILARLGDKQSRIAEVEPMVLLDELNKVMLSYLILYGRIYKHVRVLRINPVLCAHKVFQYLYTKGVMQRAGAEIRLDEIHSSVSM